MSKVVLKHHKWSYARYKEGRPGTWTERKTLFEGTFVECWNYIQNEVDHRGMPSEMGVTIEDEPPVQGPEEPPTEEGELPF